MQCAEAAVENHIRVVPFVHVRTGPRYVLQGRLRPAVELERGSVAGGGPCKDAACCRQDLGAAYRDPNGANSRHWLLRCDYPASDGVFRRRRRSGSCVRVHISTVQDVLDEDKSPIHSLPCMPNVQISAAEPLVAALQRYPDQADIVECTLAALLQVYVPLAPF